MPARLFYGLDIERPVAPPAADRPEPSQDALLDEAAADEAWAAFLVAATDDPSVP